MSRFKSIFLLMIIGLIPLIGKANSNEEVTGYKIDCQINNIKDSLVKLAYHYGDKKLLQDSAVVKPGGKFTFQGKKKLPGGIYLIVFNNNYFEIIIDNDQVFSVKSDTSDFLKNTTFKNSPDNIEFYQYLNTITPMRSDMVTKSKKYAEIKDSLPEEAEKIKNEYKTLEQSSNAYIDQLIIDKKGKLLSALLLAMKSPQDNVPLFEEIQDQNSRRQTRFNYYKKHYFDNLNLADSRLLRTPILWPRIDEYMDKVVPQIHDSIIEGVDFIMSQTGTGYESFRHILSHLTSKYEKTKLMCMEKVKKHIYETYFLKDKRIDWVDSATTAKIQREVYMLMYNHCGMKAYPLTIKDTAGVPISLLDLPNEYTIVIFWSATCGHCKKSLPKISEWYTEFKKKYDIEIYAVHIDEHKDKLTKFIRDNDLKWINVDDPNDESHFRQAYNVYSTPTIYLLDKNKTIIAKRVDEETIEKIIVEREKDKTKK